MNDKTKVQAQPKTVTNSDRLMNLAKAVVRKYRNAIKKNYGRNEEIAPYSAFIRQLGRDVWELIGLLLFCHVEEEQLPSDAPNRLASGAMLRMVFYMDSVARLLEVRTGGNDNKEALVLCYSQIDIAAGQIANYLGLK